MEALLMIDLWAQWQFIAAAMGITLSMVTQ